MSDLAELLGRVKSATGPDRSIDVAIAIAFPPEGEKRRELSDASTRCGQYWYSHNYEEGSRSALEFTASIDAALAMTERVLPCDRPNMVYSYDLNWNASAREEMAYAAELFVAEGDHPDMTSYHGQAPTMPLAILAALLSALIASGAPAMTMPETLKPDELVERLRDYNEEVRLGSGDSVFEHPPICTEAADFLEALQADLERVTAERDALVLSTGEHITMRSEYLARASTAEAALVKARTDALMEAADHLSTVAQAMWDKCEAVGAAPMDPPNRSEQEAAAFAHAFDKAADAIKVLASSNPIRAAREALKTGEDNGR